jgi:PAS domain S-box-containing protein
MDMTSAPDEEPRDAAAPGAGPGLHQRAESVWHASVASAAGLETLAPDVIRRLIHELRVRQVELEMQNEELRQTQVERSVSRTRYFDLHELSPVGYCTVNPAGLIVQANLALAGLLGVARDALLGRPLSAFVFAQDQDAYNLRHKQLMESAEPAAWDLRLLRPDGRPVWAHAAANVVPAESGESALCLVLTDISERKRAEAVLVSSQADLRRLLAALDSAQEEERKRIARELHDDLQQTLAAIRIDLAGLDEVLTTDPTAARPMLDRLDQLAQAAVTSTRRIVSDLRPQIVEELGLMAALEDLSRQFTERQGGVCRLHGAEDLDAQLLDLPGVANNLYRVVQEALNNVAKHAQATVVEVEVNRADSGLIQLRISDNGIGLRQRDRRNPESFGLLGMAERVHSLGGQLRIEGRPGFGTTVEALVPIFTPLPSADPAHGDSESTLHGDLNGAAASVPSVFEELGRPLQSVIDALLGSVSVLDRQGTIQLVNRQWREVAARHGNPDVQSSGPGVNYLEVCRRSAERDSTARPVLQGLSDVLAGRRRTFSTEYPCNMPEGRHWFRMHAAAVSGDITIVSHVNLSRGADAGPASSAEDRLP